MKPAPSNYLPSRLLPIMSATPASSIEVVFEAAEATEVFIAGDFNHWNPRGTPLRQESKGVWKTELRLPRGPHEYRLVVDGLWRSDPRAKRSRANPFGSINSILEVP
jgi:1,4-alpha-glucan branching enzyme